MTLRKRPTSLGGLPIQIDYTARDYEAILQEMLFMTTQLTPSWTDKEPGDIGVTILESVAYVADILSYQLDRVQNESYLATAQTRESVVNILRLIGYELAPASPASVSMVVRTDRAGVVLPEGFTVKTSEDSGAETLQYQLLESVTLPVAGLYCVSSDLAKATRVFAGESITTNDDLLFVAGEEVFDTFTSFGSADQIFVATQSPVCLSSADSASISVTVGGTTYDGKTSFAGTDSSSEVFVYRFTAAQELLIAFGDGINGKIPPNNDAITLTYRIDGGVDGNRAGVGTIINFDSVVGVTEVYNVVQPSGGSDPETLLEAKRKGPRSLRTLDRCVTLDDFESMALLTPGGSIRAARATQGDNPIEVKVYVASQGQNPIPSGRWYSDIQAGYGDIGAVGRWLNQKKPAPTKLYIEPPTVVNPYLEAEIHVYPNLLRQTVSFDVDVALQILFNTVTDDFGEGIPLSAISQTIENVRGVDYVNIREFHRIPVARLVSGNEDAFDLSTLLISDIDQSVVRQQFTINWLSASTFYLESSVLGLVKTELGQQKVFSADGSSQSVIFYISNPSNNEAPQQTHFDITITLDPNTSPASGDVWEFSVDDYLGNIEAQAHEIVVADVDATGRLASSQINLSYVGGI